MRNAKGALSHFAFRISHFAFRISWSPPRTSGPPLAEWRMRSRDTLSHVRSSIHMERSMATEEGRLAPLQALSEGITGAVERAGRSVVALHARARIPSSGVVWRDGVVVAAHHTVKRDDDIAVTLADGGDTRASVVGRD